MKYEIAKTRKTDLLCFLPLGLPFLLQFFLYVFLDIDKVPAFLSLVHLAKPFSTQELDEVCERQPLGTVHVDVMLVSNVFIVDHFR